MNYSLKRILALISTLILCSTLFISCGKASEDLSDRDVVETYTEQESEEVTENTETAVVSDEEEEQETSPVTVNCISGEEVQITDESRQVIKDILAGEKTIFENNNRTEDLESHHFTGYPWLVLGVPIWEHDTVAEVGTEVVKEDGEPGVSDGNWSIVSLDDVDYYYGRYDYTRDNWDLFAYVITGEEIVLENGLHTGMTEDEMFEVCPDLIKIEFEESRSLWLFNTGCYPKGFTDHYDYFYAAQILCGCEGTDLEHVPLELALLIKDGKVAGITAFSPTAG